MIEVDVFIEILLVVCAVPANGYLLFYAFRPFWVTPQGRALIIKAAGNAGLIDLGLSVVIWGEDYWLRPYVRTVVYLLFAWGLWYLFVALLRSDRDGAYPPRSWWRRRP